ncbi:MAG: energy transducer TonB [Acetobacteraceae bacterium]|nr:energy transducer TonB [Acetobacteraceae bacterium]
MFEEPAFATFLLSLADSGQLEAAYTLNQISAAPPSFAAESVWRPSWRGRRPSRLGWVLLLSLALHMLLLGVFLLAPKPRPKETEELTPGFAIQFQGGTPEPQPPAAAPNAPEIAPAPATPEVPRTPEAPVQAVPPVPVPEVQAPAPVSPPAPLPSPPAPEAPRAVEAPAAPETPRPTEAPPTPTPAGPPSEAPAVRLETPEEAPSQALPTPAPVPVPEPQPEPQPPRSMARPAPQPRPFPPVQNFSLGTPADPPGGRGSAPHASRFSRGIDMSIGTAATGAFNARPLARFEGQNPGPDWRNEFAAWVEAHKYYPEEAVRRGEDGLSGVRIIVAPDGRVKSVDLILRSGSVWLDMALQSLFRSAHLPPFPPGVVDRDLTIEVTMNYILIRQ